MSAEQHSAGLDMPLLGGRTEWTTSMLKTLSKSATRADSTLPAVTVVANGAVLTTKAGGLALPWALELDADCMGACEITLEHFEKKIQKIVRDELSVGKHL